MAADDRAGAGDAEKWCPSSTKRLAGTPIHSTYSLWLGVGHHADIEPFFQKNGRKEQIGERQEER
jgi:hypothetical protein